MRNSIIIAAAAAALLAAAPARADGGPTTFGRGIHGDGSPVPRPEVEPLLPTDPDPFPDVRLRLPRLRWQPGPGADLVDQVTLTRLPPGSLAVRYEGLQGYVVRRVRKELKSHWTRSLRDRWEGAVLDDDEYEAALTRMNEALSDAVVEGRWWERSWWHSLPPEKGGAPLTPYLQVVGQRVDVVRIGPWSLTNDLRARFDDVTIIGLDATRAVVRRPGRPFDLARSHARLDRVARASDDPEEEELEPPPLAPDEETDDALLPEPGIRLTFFPPEPEQAVGGGAWKFRLRPGIRFTLSNVEQAFVREVSLRLALTVATRKGRPPWLGVEAVLRYLPEDDVFQAGVEVAILSW